MTNNPLERPTTARENINDNLPSSSPSPQVTLIGLACLVGFIVVMTLVVIYYQTPAA